VAKAYNGLRHDVSIIETVSKHIWIILFEAWMKKRRFGGAGPTGTSHAGSQTGQADFGKFLKCMI
jgi:hypothetical protein